MNVLLNLIWLILGGFIVVIGYLLGAILLLPALRALGFVACGGWNPES